MATYRFVCFGEALWDLLPDGAVLGGAPLNLAYRIREQGRSVAIVTAVGRDPRGDAAWSRIDELGIDTRFVQRVDDLETGTVRIAFDGAGEPLYKIVAPVAYDAIDVDSRWPDAFAGAECVCYGTLAQRERRSRDSLAYLLEAIDAPMRFCDINLRPDCYSPELIDTSVRRATVIKVNRDELVELVDLFGWREKTERERLARLLAAYPDLRLAIVTRGDAGAAALSREGVFVDLPGRRVAVVDPCGAGDAFSAAFLVHYTDGASLEEAVAAGNAVGAQVATLRGATDPLPRAGRA